MVWAQSLGLPERKVTGADAIREKGGSVPRTSERGPPTQSRMQPSVKLASDGLGHAAVVMSELIGTQPQLGQHARIGAVRNPVHELATDLDPDEGEVAAELHELLRTQPGAAELRQRLAHGMLGGLGQIQHGWLVV